jgi:hypothetical protein
MGSFPTSSLVRGKIGPPSGPGNPERGEVNGTDRAAYRVGIARSNRTGSRVVAVVMGLRGMALVVLLSGLWACGLSGTGTGDRGDLPRSEAVVLFESGLEGTVRIDSLSWLPALVPLGEVSTAVELEGVFRARFTSLASRPVQIRYDLRFYDRDEFLVDAFIPFGQPVRLAPTEVRVVEGEFRLQSTAATDLGRIAAMRLYATVADTSS